MSHSKKLSLVVSLLSANLALAEPVSLFPGWPAEVVPGDVIGVKVADPAIASAAISEKGALVLTGLREGSTQVEVWRAGAPASTAIEVKVQASGWDLIPVLVATRDVSEETPLTEEMAAIRYLPRALVTASVVRADGKKYVLNQPTVVPVQAGDPLLWSQFERKRR